MRPLVFVLVASVAAAVLYAVLLLGASPAGGAPLSGEWWLPLLLTISFAIGWSAWRFLGGAPSVAAAVIAPPLAVTLFITVSALRSPGVPAVAGPWIVLAVTLTLFALAGLIGNAVARIALPALPAPLRSIASATMFGLASVATTVLLSYAGLAFGGR